MLDRTCEPRCGLPHKGLFHRFLEGYLWPSHTGGMDAWLRFPADKIRWMDRDSGRVRYPE